MTMSHCSKLVNIFKDYILILRSTGGCGEVEELSGGEQLVVPEAPVIITHHFLLYKTLGNIFSCHVG